MEEQIFFTLIEGILVLRAKNTFFSNMTENITAVVPSTDIKLEKFHKFDA